MKKKLGCLYIATKDKINGFGVYEYDQDITLWFLMFYNGLVCFRLYSSRLSREIFTFLIMIYPVLFLFFRIWCRLYSTKAWKC
jgi:hypothetical protein